MMKTQEGKTVTHLRYAPYTTEGHRASYPIKGVIVRNERPRKTEYCIWDEKGRCFGGLPDSALWPHQREKQDRDNLNADEVIEWLENKRPRPE